MRIVCISDTHNRTLLESVPDGDVLIHAGDATVMGKLDEINNFAEWFLSFPHKHKIFVAGNHDWLYFNNMPLAKTFVPNLHDEQIEIEGLKIYGSSWQPEFHNWAFGLPRGRALKGVWSKIPDDTDILVTHSPPKNILDSNYRGEAVGCEELFKRVMEIRPKLHVFGHIHENFGQIEMNGTIFVNASICDRAYKAKRKPIVIDL